MLCSARFNFRSSTLLFLIYVNDMSQVVECNLYLYADDSRLLFQHESVTKIKKQLTKDFSDICDWFVDNKLSIHFGEARRNQFYLVLNVI